MKSPQRPRGVALVIVLACLVLVSILVVSFLSSVSTELKSSKTHADGANVKLLSESAVNLAISQIKAGTAGRDSSNGILAWASQPGMIRTYNASGQPAAYYKLYSSGTMTGTGGFTDDTVPASWDTSKGLFTDLNEPMLGRYPILNPAAVGKVEGFTIDAANAAVTGKTNPAPMPVRWLYILKDGKLAVPSGGSAGKADFSASTVKPTTTNPIVGRVAFWADDESCKVNINTASEGSFWDTPKVFSTYEKMNLADKQPANHEYQRYPGHPATTSLSAVFGGFSNTLNVTSGTDYAKMLPYYTLTPRVAGGGSQSATVSTLAATPVAVDSDRLYATIDEMEFRPTRVSLTDSSIPIDPDTLEQTKFFLTANSRAPDVNLFNKPRVCIWPVDARDDVNHRTIFDRLIAFCETIGGKAYYFQRQNADSATEDLPVSAAATGVGRNRALIDYLKKLTSTAIPGFGGNFATKYGTDERDQILTEIFDYIRSTNLIDINNNQAGYVPFTPQVVSETKGVAGSGQAVPIADTVSDTRGFGRFPTVTEGAFIFYATADPTTAPNLFPPSGGATAPNPNQILVRAVFLPEMYTVAGGYASDFSNFQIRVKGLDQLTWVGLDPATNLPITDAATGMASSNMGFPANPAAYKIAQTSGVTLTRLFGASKGIRMFHHNLTTTTNPGGFSAAKILPSFAGSTSDPKMTSHTPTHFYFSGGDVTVEVLNSAGTLVQSVQMRFPAGTFPVPRLCPDASSLGLNMRAFSSENSAKDRATPVAPTAAVPTIPADNLNPGRFKYFGSGDAASEIKVCWVTQWDTVRSMVADGDFRIVAGRNTITAPDLFATAPGYASQDEPMAHSLNDCGFPFYGASRGRLAKDAQYYRYDQVARNINLIKMSGSAIVNGSGSGLRISTGDMDLPGYNGVALGKTGEITGADTPGDWDNGVGDCKDGPLINKPDDGSLWRESATDPPYFNPSNYRVTYSYTFFSPNRQIPSPVMFGSLPTGVKRNLPWQTLQFRPAPTNHPGLVTPRDHLLLDFFHMPVVEPYAISEPLSTAGRINMNYQIQPFTYINRDTGIRAVLKSERMLAVPASVAAGYKDNSNPPVNPTPADLRMNLGTTSAMSETLKGFQQKFASNDIFRSASEICDIHLVPDGQTYAGMATFWNAYPLTGDNSRERPYATIYPRLTTKSNTFTIHCRVQSLQRPTARLTSAPAEFDTAKGDKVTGEYRGATIVERYVDPNEPGLPDFANTATFTDPASDLDKYYRFRVVSAKKFTP